MIVPHNFSKWLSQKFPNDTDLPSAKGLIAAPAVYAMAIPLVFLDICAELYQLTVFSFLEIEKVPRSEYIRIDRYKLKYLNPFMKIGCVYCGYANGLSTYIMEILARTESYFCPIQHENTDDDFHPPKHHEDFANFGDEIGYKRKENILKGRRDERVN